MEGRDEEREGGKREGREGGQEGEVSQTNLLIGPRLPKEGLDQHLDLRESPLAVYILPQDLRTLWIRVDLWCTTLFEFNQRAQRSERRHQEQNKGGGGRGGRMPGGEEDGRGEGGHQEERS